MLYLIVSILFVPLLYLFAVIIGEFTRTPLDILLFIGDILHRVFGFEKIVTIFLILLLVLFLMLILQKAWKVIAEEKETKKIEKT